MKGLLQLFTRCVPPGLEYVVHHQNRYVRNSCRNRLDASSVIPLRVMVKACAVH